MSFFGNLAARLPFLDKPPSNEYFFALNIGVEKLTVALWTIEGKHLKIVNASSSSYQGSDDLVPVTDKLLDQALGELNIEPQKILFGVPDSWLVEDDLKEPQLKLLRLLVKELELQPMAYVASSHALAHLLENIEGVPTTAILVGVYGTHVEVTVTRAGKVDGSKVVTRSDNLGEDIEKALLNFTEVEVLPSKILIYGGDSATLEKHKNQLSSFPWMQKLSFLHLPKLDILEEAVEIKGIAFAGAVELDNNVKYVASLAPNISRSSHLNKLTEEVEAGVVEREVKSDVGGAGFVAGDVMNQESADQQEVAETPNEMTARPDVVPSESVVMSSERVDSDEDFPEENIDPSPKSGFPILAVILSKVKKVTSAIPMFRGRGTFLGVALAVILLIVAYLLLPQAQVTVYVEPRILERDTQVTADPNIKVVDEANKKIPGQIVEVSVSGSGKGSATGKKEIGDPAKGTVKVINNSNQAQTLTQGTTISASGIKFTLDKTVNVASTSATSDSKSTATAPVTAATVGPDGNLPSGTQLSSGNSQVAIVTEGNFSGGTSKQVTVVTDEDQKKLLASIASDLRKQATEQLQAKLNGKKILEEALSEEITKKSYSKNINDQAAEFSLNMTIQYKGTAYLEDDLKMIVSKLVTTEVPSDFELNLAETETQADVSKVEKDGRLVFLARFRAKLLPKFDVISLKKEIRGKTPAQVAEVLKKHENILGSDIKITPSLPGPLQRLPLLDRNIKIEISLK